MKKNKVLLGLMLGTLLVGSLSYSNTFKGITRERVGVLNMKIGKQ